MDIFVLKTSLAFFVSVHRIRDGYQGNSVFASSYHAARGDESKEGD